MRPDELDDAAVPDQHHLEEALARPLRVLIPVGEHVGSVFGHFDCTLFTPSSSFTTQERSQVRQFVKRPR